MPMLAPILPYLAVASAGLQMAGTIAQGNAARASANNQAAQFNQQAGQTRATAQREAEAERRKGEYASSRAQAVQAAGGADPDSFTSVTNETNLVGQGEYGALTAMFNGEEKARGLDYAATNKHIEGNAAHDAGVTNGITNFASAMTKQFATPSKPTTATSGTTLYSQYSDTVDNPDMGYGPFQPLPWQV